MRVGGLGGGVRGVRGGVRGVRGDDGECEGWERDRGEAVSAGEGEGMKRGGREDVLT